MSTPRFEWNPRKAQANLRKHGISFTEAATAFEDDYAKLLPDAVHSDGEERFYLLGCTDQGHLLTICHCYRGAGDVIRLISARKADYHEVMIYREG